jgi:hypothetical protein
VGSEKVKFYAVDFVMNGAEKVSRGFTANDRN